MASRWDGNSGKLRPFVKRGESKRTSVKVPKADADFGEQCRERAEYDPDTSTSTPLSRPRLYTPESRYNYKSAWARYQRGLELRPSKIEQDGNCTVYYFKSCDALTGYWEVRVCPGGATYLEAGRSLTILCPPLLGYQLEQIDSDGEVFVWEQIAGNRTVIVDPPTAKNPRILIQPTCSTSGCDDGSSLPIILKVYPEGQPELFDFLTIFNTPTSIKFDNSFVPIGKVDKACQIVSIAPAPLYEQRAYCHNGEDIGITWSEPCDSEYLTRYLIQTNADGSYTTIDTVLSNEERFFLADVNTKYQILSEFNVYGKITRVPSQSIYFSYAADDNQHLVFADDTHNGISQASIRSEYSKVNLSVKVVEAEDNYASDNSFTAIASDYQKVNLSVQTIEVTESYNQTNSFTYIKSAYQKVNLGGIVIG